LINYVDGNPLALKLVATSIQNLFNGDVRAFLAQGTAVFGNLWELIDRQFDRLSALQQQVMYWLAIDREGVTPVEREIIAGELDLFRTHALIEAQTKDYLRDDQIQLIL
jgi:hypothetical protein